ncbi:MAG: hypothetical protein R6V86_09085 [Spirochaetia bacterium]
MKYPTNAQLVTALQQAAKLHHSYEQVYLSGKRDSLWSGFYAAYILGRCGSFLPAERVAEELDKVPADSEWSISAAKALLEVLDSNLDTAKSAQEESPAAETSRQEIMYVCPNCFAAADLAGKCSVCGHQLYEFRPGDANDPCRCPVVNDRGEVVTHAPLWWLRSVAPELAERMGNDRNRNEKK